MDQFLYYVTLPAMLEGAWEALKIAFLALLFAWPAALALALLSSSRFLPARWSVGVFGWGIRGTPLLLQLIFFYNALPAWGIDLSSTATAVLALAINEAAFSAEIMRGGLSGVPTSQIDAAKSLGMSDRLTLWRVRIPQALRGITPALANDAITTVKNTSLASAIAVAELTLRSQQLVSINFEFVPVFLAAAVIYLMLTTALMGFQYYSERRMQPRSPRRRKRVRATAGSGSDTTDGADAVALDLHHPAFEKYCDEIRVAARRPSDSTGPMVRVTALYKSIGSVGILNGIDLTVEKGEVVCVIGPSGSGKTTLLRALGGLDSVDSGAVVINGVQLDGQTGLRGRVRPTDRLRAGIAFVFQQFHLFHHMTVAQNLAESPCRVLSLRPSQTRTVHTMLLNEVGLGEYQDRYPHELSGGQQQRVAIARALALAPELMLFDEPTSALDPERVGGVLRVIRELAEQGMTMIVVTHEIAFAQQCASRVVFIDEGRIVESGPPREVLSNPTQERTQGFLAALHYSDLTEPSAPPSDR